MRLAGRIHAVTAGGPLPEGRAATGHRCISEMIGGQSFPHRDRALGAAAAIAATYAEIAAGSESAATLVVASGSTDGNPDRGPRARPRCETLLERHVSERQRLWNGP